MNEWHFILIHSLPSNIHTQAGITFMILKPYYRLCVALNVVVVFFFWWQKSAWHFLSLQVLIP